MRKKIIRVYVYYFSDGIFLSHFKRDDMSTKPRKARYIIFPCCYTKMASQMVGRLRRGYANPTCKMNRQHSQLCVPAVTDAAYQYSKSWACVILSPIRVTSKSCESEFSPRSIVTEVTLKNAALLPDAHIVTT
jgi:hypothetical protein